MTVTWVIPLTPTYLFVIALLVIYIIGSWIILISSYYRLKQITLLEEYIRDLEGGLIIK